MVNNIQDFPKKARLLNKEQINRVFDGPMRNADGHFVVLAKCNDGHQARLGLAISKKCSRYAVNRNRIKRIIRESFRLNRHRLYGFDFVVLCCAGVQNRSRRDLWLSINQHWNIINKQLCGD